MKELNVYADEFQTTFANVGDMMRFLTERGKASKWIRKPTKSLRLIPLEKELEQMGDVPEEILEDTDRNTQLVLKIKGDLYPVRKCAIRTILSRAGVSGTALRKLEKTTYARVVNYCLQVASGDSLIKVSDGKVSAVHGGDAHDYCILDMKTIFEATMKYLHKEFKGSTYLEGSGMYDHFIVSAMWKLGGKPELLDSYQEALNDHGINCRIEAPVLRLVTSDVAASGANLYPMLLCDSGNKTICLGSPIKLSHDKGATIEDFERNLERLYARYEATIKNISKLMDIEIANPVNCMRLIMKKLKIKQKITNETVELFQAQYGTSPCTAHDIYFAMNEASFIAACEGMQGEYILNLEEDIAKALSFDWSEYDVSGMIKF